MDRKRIASITRAVGPIRTAMRLSPARWSLRLLLVVLALAAPAQARLPPSAWPADPPALIELGRLLFYDRALSINGSMSCASCHRQELAFTDGLPVAVGATGQRHRRNSPSLANVAWFASLGWSNPTLWQLPEQHLVPLVGTDPIELGVTEPLAKPLRARLVDHPRYRDLLATLPDDVAVRWAAGPDLAQVTQALAAFVRSLVSQSSPFDAWLNRDDAAALGDQARAGYRLFASTKLQCAACHSGPLLGGALRSQRREEVPRFARNPLQSPSSIVADRGLAEHTGRAADVGRFRVPSLRNVAVTAPYMHDGSLPDLPAVLAHYERGIPPSPGQPSLEPFRFSDAERDALIAFLQSLTDPVFLADPRQSDPWQSAPAPRSLKR